MGPHGSPHWICCTLPYAESAYLNQSTKLKARLLSKPSHGIETQEVYWAYVGGKLNVAGNPTVVTSAIMTTDKEEAKMKALNGSGVQVIGHVFKKQLPGMVPLYRWVCVTNFFKAELISSGWRYIERYGSFGHYIFQIQDDNNSGAMNFENVWGQGNNIYLVHKILFDPRWDEKKIIGYVLSE